MTLSILIAPAAEPVSVAELKTFLQLVHDSEDALLGACIRTARDLVEAFTSRAIVTRRVRERRAEWGLNDAGALRLALAPVSSVVSISVRDVSGLFPMLSGVVQLDGDAGLVVPPSTPAPFGALGGIQFDYDAGYGDAGAGPPALKHAVLVAAAALFRERDGGRLSEAARALAAPFARQRL